MSANDRFASRFHGACLPRAPARRLAVVTCMDARIDPPALLGLVAGDANVIRNAGGIVTDDVLRSLAVSNRILGAKEVLVVGHTDCGLHGLDEREAGLGMPLYAFDDLDERVRESVRAIRERPFLDLAASGAVYDVLTGRLRLV